MKNLFILPLAVCLVGFVVSSVDAQYGYGSPDMAFGAPAYGYGSGNDSYTDPRLGYCLKNDCFAQGQGCGGGCYGCQPTVRVRVTIGGPGGTPTVQTYYPQVQYGVPGGYGNNQQNAPAENRYVTNRPQPQRSAKPAVRPRATSASYRYRF